MPAEPFLVALDLAGRRVVAIGAGQELERRTLALLAAGAAVRVVSPAPGPALLRLAAAGDLELCDRAFEPEDLDDAWLSVLTEREPELAARVAAAAAARRVFHVTVDLPDRSSYAHVALARSGPVTVGISTGGKAPALARRLREELERLFARAALGAFAERLAELRLRTPSEARAEVLGRAVAGLTLVGELRLPPAPSDDA